MMYDLQVIGSRNGKTAAMLEDGISLGKPFELDQGCP
jgi:hypothetical protein